MFQEFNRRDFTIGLVMLGVISCALLSVSAATSRVKTTSLNGHVLGYRLHPLKHVGDGPDGIYFVFIPDSDKAKVPQVSPVLIAYSFFSDETPLPNSFFDYSKHFQIKVSRNADCDQTAAEVFYIKIEYTDKHEKGSRRDYFFSLSAGAPKMNFADDLSLPCYDM